MNRELTKLSVHRFRVQVEGHFLGDNGTLGWNQAQWPFQCVNVPGSFLKLGGLEQSPGSAIELNYSGYGRFIRNEPVNFPKAGDIPIFQGGAYDAVSGHTGLALHNSDERKLHTLWQNDPEESPCQMLYVPYENCIGWWRIDWARHGVELEY